MSTTRTGGKRSAPSRCDGRSVLAASSTLAALRVRSWRCGEMDRAAWNAREAPHIGSRWPLVLHESRRIPAVRLVGSLAVTSTRGATTSAPPSTPPSASTWRSRLGLALGLVVDCSCSKSPASPGESAYQCPPRARYMPATRGDIATAGGQGPGPGCGASRRQYWPCVARTVRDPPIPAREHVAG